MSDDPNREPSDIPPLPRPWGAPAEDESRKEPPIGGGFQPAEPTSTHQPAHPPDELSPTGPPTVSPVAPAPPKGRGCATPIVIGCGCLGLLIGILFIAGIVLSPRLVNWFLDTSENAVISALPAETSDQDRATLQAGFSAYREGMADGTLSTRGLMRLNSEIAESMQLAQRGELQTGDVQRLLEAFRFVFPGLEGGESPNAPDAPSAPDLERGERSLPIAVMPPRGSSAVLTRG